MAPPDQKLMGNHDYEVADRWWRQGTEDEAAAYKDGMTRDCIEFLETARSLAQSRGNLMTARELIEAMSDIYAVKEGTSLKDSILPPVVLVGMLDGGSEAMRAPLNAFRDHGQAVEWLTDRNRNSTGGLGKRVFEARVTGLRELTLGLVEATEPVEPSNEAENYDFRERRL